MSEKSLKDFRSVETGEWYWMENIHGCRKPMLCIPGGWASTTAGAKVDDMEIAGWEPAERIDWK
jgi:hypothetical protein